MDQRTFSTPLSLKDLKITDSFWKKEMELVRKEVIPYQWEALNDRIPDAAPSYCMRNFKVAGKLNQEKKRLGEAYREPQYTFRGFEALPEDPEHLEDRFYGFVFQDSDFSKWIEAVAYSLTQHPDPELEALADGAIDVVCAAQQEDGYLDTYYIINGKDKIFSNLRDHHELYCFGHLTEGAVAYYQATGKDQLLKAAMRFADYIAGYFGEEEGKCKGYPGHEIAEMALARLYEVTGQERYLTLSRFFIDQRGTKPYYFDTEHQIVVSPDKQEELRYQYHQAHLPVRQQEEAVGHAVRAVYLYSGMADVARLSGDESLYLACEKLWDNITLQKMYITGGIGGTHMGEAFSFPYDLPNDTAYAETCASIGLVFFARRMLEISPKSKYADVMELALYNGILSGMALDGKSFFYVNPLEVNPESCHKDERKFHVKPVRQKWFGCACCPPNLARLVSSIGSYAYTENDDTLFVHLYVGGTLTKQIRRNTGALKQQTGELSEQYENISKEQNTAQLEIQSGFPWNGDVRIRVCAKDMGLTLALRIPSWCDRYTLALDGEEIDMTGRNGTDSCSRVRFENGYLYIDGFDKEEEILTLNFNMEPRWMSAFSKVREDAGKVALQRGPIVYCLEERDNGPDLHRLLADPAKQPVPYEAWILDEKVIALKAQGIREKQMIETEDAAENPFGQDSAGNGIMQEGSLYRKYQVPETKPVELTYIPYYTWANRGENEMQVWTRRC